MYYKEVKKNSKKEGASKGRFLFIIRNARFTLHRAYSRIKKLLALEER